MAIQPPFKRMVLSCSALASSLGVLGILAWTTGQYHWASFSAHYIPMAPLTAAGFVLLGFSLFLYGFSQWHRSVRLLGAASALLVAFLSLSILHHFFLGTAGRLETFFIRHPVAFGAVPTGRLSPITAVALFLSACGVLALMEGGRGSVAAGVAFCVILVDVVVLLGYLYGTPLLYGGTVIPMALTTAIAFLFLNIGLLAAAGPDHFPLKPLLRNSTRALLLRTFLPVSGVAVVTDGLIHHFFFLSLNPAFLSAVSALIATAVVTGVVSRVSQTVGSEIDRAEEHIQLELERLNSLRAIDTAITTGLDLQSVLNVVLEQTTTQLNAHAASVLLLAPELQTLQWGAGHGFRSDHVPLAGCLIEEGVATRVILERRTVMVRHLREAPAHFQCAPWLMEEGFISYFGVPLIAKNEIKGVLEVFHRNSFTPPNSEWLDYLETLAGQAAIAIENAGLFADLQRANAELTMAYDTTLEGWSRALDLRDKGTEGHSVRVSEITVRLAREIGLLEPELVHIRRGALLHDIGKIGIPDHILLKPGPLNPEERAIMNQHPEYGYHMLSPIAYLRPALDIPYCHHERWDGNGYPRGLKGEEIPLIARIFSIVDIWDALVSERPYHLPWPKEKVRDHLQSLSGKQLDPKVVELFLRLEIQGKLEEPGQDAMAV